MTTPATPAPTIATPEPATGDPSNAPAPDLAAAISAAIAPLVERLTAAEGRMTQFGQDLGKARAKVRKIAAPGVTPEAADDVGEGGDRAAHDPSSAMLDEQRAAFALADALAGIPSEARQAIQGAVTSGDMTFAAALDRATFLKAYLPETGKEPQPQGVPPPDGKPATGARSPGGHGITTRAAFSKLQAEDPGKAFELVSTGQVVLSELKGPPPRRAHPLEL